MKRFMFMMFLVSGIFLLGCQSQKGGEQKQQRRQVRGNQQNLVIPQRFDDSRYRYLSSVGRIFSDSRYSTEFNHAIRSLLSATLDSNDIGQVNPFDGVRLMGYIEFDDRGQLISGRSFIRIEVHDSFVGQVQDGHRIEPIVIQVPVTAARFVSGYQFEVRAEDQHGWILLQGIDQYGRSVGQLSFRNTNGRWGEGLSFEIETCGFFRCHK